MIHFPDRHYITNKEIEMQPNKEDDPTIYMAVVNEEEQYSIWPEHRPLPLGWSDTNVHGLKAECLAYIERVWTDMRPLSLRIQMGKLQGNSRDSVVG
jgi:MbtH protein